MNNKKQLQELQTKLNKLPIPFNRRYIEYGALRDKMYSVHEDGELIVSGTYKEMWFYIEGLLDMALALEEKVAKTPETIVTIEPVIVECENNS